jgi:hypothetical protein
VTRGSSARASWIEGGAAAPGARTRLPRQGVVLEPHPLRRPAGWEQQGRLPARLLHGRTPTGYPQKQCASALGSTRALPGCNT